MENSLVNSIKENKTMMIVIGMALVAIIAAVVWRVYQNAKKGTQALGDIVGREIVYKQIGVPPPRQLVCEGVATEAHTAIHGLGGWFKIPGFSNDFTEDEDAFIDEINKLKTPAEAAYTSTIYKTLWTKRSLKADAKKYLNSTEQRRIKAEIFNSLS